MPVVGTPYFTGTTVGRRPFSKIDHDSSLSGAVLLAFLMLPITTAWIDPYNTERQHSALGYLSPWAWREQFFQAPQAV